LLELDDLRAVDERVRIEQRGELVEYALTQRLMNSCELEEGDGGES
jgi:hypothetical protein